MKISYQLTERDVLFAQSETGKRYGALTFGIAFAASLSMYRWHPGVVSLDFSLVLIPACLGVLLVVAYLLAIRKASRRAYLAAIGPLPITATMTLTDEDVEFSSPHGRSIIPFSRVVACSMTSTHILVVLRPWTVVAIPRVAFDSDEACASFAACVRDRARC
jgi:hypothetical protein